MGCQTSRKVCASCVFDSEWLWLIIRAVAFNMRRARQTPPASSSIKTESQASHQSSDEEAENVDPLDAGAADDVLRPAVRSEERSVGNECGGTWRYRWSP